MTKELHINLYNMILSLSNAIDLVNSTVYNHHKRVAYIAYSIADELRLTKEEQTDLIMAGALHDIGAIFMQGKLDGMEFETGAPYKHAEMGYLFLKRFTPFNKIAKLVRYHHLYWSYGKGEELRGEQVPLGSHILHLADRVEVLINREHEILGQVDDIRVEIEKKSGIKFKPDLVKAFFSLSKKEVFWLDLVSPDISTILAKQSSLATVQLDMDGILDLSKLFSQIIDFRSRFTAIHSSGVAAIGEALASLFGWTRQECLMMRIAGYFHDLGKLAVPIEILEKPDKLTNDEYNVIKSHTYHTNRILSDISDLDMIIAWASNHHERLDGTGYPFRNNEQTLCLGSRIMAVADVFTAITEDRPYRQGMERDRVIKVLDNMAKEGALDAKVVSIITENYNELNLIRKFAQKAQLKEYQQFEQQLSMISKK